MSAGATRREKTDKAKVKDSNLEVITNDFHSERRVASVVLYACILCDKPLPLCPPSSLERGTRLPPPVGRGATPTDPRAAPQKRE